MSQKKIYDEWEWLDCSFNLRRLTKNYDYLWNLSSSIGLSHPLYKVNK